MWSNFFVEERAGRGSSSRSSRGIGGSRGSKVRKIARVVMNSVVVNKRGDRDRLQTILPLLPLLPLPPTRRDQVGTAHPLYLLRRPHTRWGEG